MQLATMQYPKWKYHPEREAILVQDPQEEKNLETGWFDSPADFGIETSPGKRPDKEIAKKKKAK